MPCHSVSLSLYLHKAKAGRTLPSVCYTSVQSNLYVVRMFAFAYHISAQRSMRTVRLYGAHYVRHV